VTKYYVYSFRYDCDNAIMLRNRLKGQRIKLVDSSYQEKPGDVVINWGNSKCPYVNKVVNHPIGVGFAVNKSITFDLLRNAGIKTPEITRSPKVVARWLTDGHRVLGRTILTGNNGAGIVWCEKDKPIPEAKLYVKYIPNTTEFRVNVYRGKEISVRAKERDGAVEANPIRSGNNGYFFKDAVMAPALRESLLSVADAATRCLGLDFSGVDVLVDQAGNITVLEVNTAPELRGDAMTRLSTYIQADYGV